MLDPRDDASVSFMAEASQGRDVLRPRAGEDYADRMDRLELRMYQRRVHKW